MVLYFNAEWREVRFSISTESKEPFTLIHLLSAAHSRPDEGHRHCVLMEPCGYRQFRVGGFDYLLKRTNA